MFGSTVKMPRLVIIEAPFKDSPQIMTEYLKRCVRDTVQRGEAAMTSVAVYCLTGALDDLKPDERKTGIALGLAWYRAAQAAVCYVDYGISRGMAQGIEAAARAGIPVEYREIGRNHDPKEMQVTAQVLTGPMVPTGPWQPGTVG